MANKIKGLTVEIGGDTTKLGKALEDVNKKSRDLSSELGDINRLLKLDPGNADLLAQKQKVLAEAVNNTSKKLETLKDAERQVQEQFKRGEVSESQVRALQREIVATEKKMESYEGAITDVNAALNKHGEAGKNLTKQEKKLAKLQKEYAKFSEKGLECHNRAKNLKVEIEKLTASLGKNEGAMAGAAAETGNFGSKMASVAKVGLGAVTAAAGAAVGGLVAAAESTREYRKEMGKLEVAFTTSGHSSEAAKKTYQTLQGVLGETEQAVEAANHLAKLAKNEEDLTKWTNIATGVFATFGASLPVENITEAANETAKTGKIVGGLADALNWAGVSEEQFQEKLDACTTEQERQALITETLNGLYSDAADAYRETNAEIIRANEANEAWTASLAGAGAAVDPILTDVKLLGASMLADLLPSITQTTDAFHGLMTGMDGAAEELGAALSNIIDQLLTKVVELAPTLGEVATTLVTTLVTSLLGMLPDVLDAAIDLLLVIVEAIPVVVTELAKEAPRIVSSLIQTLMKRLPDLIKAAGQLLMGIIQAIPPFIVSLVKEMPTIVVSIVNGLLDGIDDLVEVGADLLGGLLEGMLDPKAIWKAAKGVVNSVVGAFESLFDIHSPSRVIRDRIGAQLSAGLAEGITENADEPIDAMDALTSDLLGENELNGLTLDRKLSATFGGNAVANEMNAGLLGKLDSILAAIERGQVLMIDKDTLVGSTVTSYDNKLGQRRVLAARGAL